MSFILFFLQLLSWIFNKGAKQLQPKLTVELGNNYIMEMDVANFTAKRKNKIIS